VVCDNPILCIKHPVDCFCAVFVPPPADHLISPFTNWSPLATAMTATDVTEKLQLAKIKDKLWYVVPTIATDGNGLNEAFEWLSKNTDTKSKK